MVELEEIRNALFDIGNDKAPRPDVFGSFFFKASWNIIGSDVFDDVHEFFISGRLLKQ